MVLAAEDLGDFGGDLMGCLAGGGTDEEVFEVQQSVHPVSELFPGDQDRVAVGDEKIR